MTVVFSDELQRDADKRFQAWRRDHPAGFCAHVKDPRSYLLHSTRCFHLGSTGWGLRSGASLTKRAKVCPGSLDELGRWAATRTITLSGCEHCLPEGTHFGLSQTYVEGEAGQVTKNCYERDPAARHECIRHYGCACVACGFKFEAVYGRRGRGFIQVHHLRALSKLGKEHEVDPIRDLRPVCPNCHAMIHAGKDMLSVEALKALVGRHAGRS